MTLTSVTSKQSAHFLLGMLVTGCLITQRTIAEGYYAEPPIFSTRPDETKSLSIIERTGPIGLSVDLIPPAFTIRIKGVEEGSPAAATGKLKAGQIIASVNGKTLADVDPRAQIAQWIAEAEATDGKLVLAVSEKPGGAAENVTVTVPVIGKYSATWPLDCPKSEKIVRNFAEYLKQPGAHRGFGDIGMLFLLSTGDERDLEAVKAWTRELIEKGIDRYPHQWVIGYGGLALCEYYLRTGDKEVLTLIQAVADKAISLSRFGGWGNRMPLAAVTYGGGGGHLNASGTLCVAYLLLAKQCGAEMRDEDLNRILTHFYRWAGRGNVPYGNNKPESGFVDNGKNGQLALAMAAAASLTPDGEKSIYARARDTMALFSFPSTGYMLHGHTGGGIGEISRSAAMGLLAEKMPHHYREFMDQRKWHYELSRRFDGSFGILGGGRYDNEEWGAAYAMSYTVPRKSLRLTGAPPTPHCKVYKLPERPWGTPEDDDFESIEPIAMPDGTHQDILKENLSDVGGPAAVRKVQSEPDRETVMYMLHHPVITLREMFSGNLAGYESEEVIGFLKSDDARMRHVAAHFLSGEGLDAKFRSAEIHGLLTGMLKDENESWFVKTKALDALARFPADMIVADLDIILPYMKHEEWWLNQSALTAVTPIMGDLRTYKPILAAVKEMLDDSYNYALHGQFRWSAIPKVLAEAPEEVRQHVGKVFGELLAEYDPYEDPIEQMEGLVNPIIKETLAHTIIAMPGGYETLFHAAKARNPDIALPFQELFLAADRKEFGPELRKEVDQLIANNLIPEYIEKNRRALEIELSGKASGGPKGLDDLAALYARMGVDEYAWHDFGPDMEKMEWWYHSFDPPETLSWDSPGHVARYREVTVPKGMENWFSPEFDPQKASWKRGQQPFGALHGKLVTEPTECADWCRHGLPMKTLWEKEALLLNGDFEIPKLKQGHRYRLIVGGMSHVGNGEGFLIYVNGKPFFERKRGVWSREGGRPIAMVIDNDWRPDFDGRKVNISHLGFMDKGKRGFYRQLSIWIQEMKIPPVPANAGDNPVPASK